MICQTISGDAPNWQAYLVKRPYLLWLRDHSTHQTATCQYTIVSKAYTDYLRASLEDYAVIREVPTVVDVCRSYEYVNTQANMCVNCTAATYKKRDFPFSHRQLFKYFFCDLNGNGSGNVISYADKFGL